MSWRTRIRYDLEVMSRFRFPMPSADDPEVTEEDREEVWNDQRAFLEQKERELEEVTEHYLTDEADEGDWSGPPDPLTDELAWVGDQLQWLQAYRDRLIVFARTFASDTVPVRTIGSCTRLSHSTVVRMITDEAIADIAPMVAPVAFNYLESDFDPREDPEFYRRLRASFHSIQEVDR